MQNYDFKLFIPKTRQPHQKPLYTPPISQGKKPIVLFSINTLTQGIKDYISEEDIDILYDFIAEADKEDLYGIECKDDILNDNEQKTFFQNIKDKHPKLCEIVNSFIEKLQIKSDEEKIANILYLKEEDSNMLSGNEQLITYGLEYLNNDNLMSVSKHYNNTCMLYQLYADVQDLAEKYEKVINEEFDPEEWYVENDDDSEEKINEKRQKYENRKNEDIKSRNKALKDLETIKEKSLDYANHIIQLARKNNIYIKDYEQALETAIEKNDIKNITIYTQRLSDRVFMLFDREEKSVNASKRAIELKEPNGQIDTTFVQGYTGDCWFLSALKSMCGNPEILEMINNMITVNKDGNTIKSVTVNIQGKDYTFDYKNIKDANEYATGDLDVRALEMALNQHMHDNNLGHGDITLGGSNNDAYKFLFGEDNVEITEYEANGHWYEFDYEKYLNTLKGNKDSKIISCLSIYSNNDWYHDEDKLFAEDTDGNQVELHFNHIYNYSKIDDNFLFFTDPHAPEKELKIQQERVGKVFDGACTVKFKNNKEQASL